MKVRGMSTRLTMDCETKIFFSKQSCVKNLYHQVRAAKNILRYALGVVQKFGQHYQECSTQTGIFLVTPPLYQKGTFKMLISRPLLQIAIHHKRHTFFLNVWRPLTLSLKAYAVYACGNEDNSGKNARMQNHAQRLDTYLKLVSNGHIFP